MIRRFLGLPVDDCDVQVHDERENAKKFKDDFSKKSIDESFKKIDESKKGKKDWFDKRSLNQ